MVTKMAGKKIAITHIDPYRCMGCRTCVQSCMNDVLRMRRGKAIIVYQSDCSACFACENDCPRDAICFGLMLPLMNGGTISSSLTETPLR